MHYGQRRRPISYKQDRVSSSYLIPARVPSSLKSKLNSLAASRESVHPSGRVWGGLAACLRFRSFLRCLTNTTGAAGHAPSVTDAGRSAALIEEEPPSWRGGAGGHVRENQFWVRVGKTLARVVSCGGDGCVPLARGPSGASAD
ncbi:hypothetical protein MTO96_009694 [Rhipicephalus appendiculatus]